jgi:hypothetical protein
MSILSGLGDDGALTADAFGEHEHMHICGHPSLLKFAQLPRPDGGKTPLVRVMIRATLKKLVPVK